MACLARSSLRSSFAFMSSGYSATTLTNGSSAWASLKQLASQLRPIALLLLRLTMAVVFIKTGLDKVAAPEATSGFFASVGIPFPLLNAYLAGGTELIGGALLLLGLGTRLICLALSFVMIVALVTVHSASFGDLTALFKETAWNYLVALALLLSTGPGLISADALIKVE